MFDVPVGIVGIMYIHQLLSIFLSSEQSKKKLITAEILVIPLIELT